MKITACRLFFIVYFLFAVSPAYAYLDGGTGTVLVQILLAGIAGFVAVLRLYWLRLKQACAGLFRKFTRKQVIPPSLPEQEASKQDPHGS